MAGISKLGILLFFTFISTSVFAQKSFKKANKQFELQAYELAIVNYEATLKENPDHAGAKLFLGECYRMLNQPQDALYWYEQVPKTEDAFPAEMVINYAHTLKALGLYERAKIWYWNYNAENPSLGNHYAASCDYAMTLLNKDARYVVSTVDINSVESDFGSGFFIDKMVWATFRKDLTGKEAMLNVSRIQPPENLLVMEGSEANSISVLGSKSKMNTGIGPASYSKSGKMIAFTKNAMANGHRHLQGDEKGLSIYYALTTDEGDFEKAVAFPYNSQDFSNAFPNLSFNGQAMYFASNKPGGFGEFDIYVSYFKNGRWAEPENLGATVNSLGNEITPHFDGQELYFASDYHFGLGNFDLFVSRVGDSDWSKPENLGQGLNTPADDYYPYHDQANDIFYFTSNRAAGIGKDDIYIAFPLKPTVAMDAKTNKIALDSHQPNSPGSALVAEKMEDNVSEAEDEIYNQLKEEYLELAKAEESSEAEEAFKWDNAKLSLDGASRISMGEIVDTGHKVYFIQLAALSKTEGDFDRYRKLVDLGNIYRSMQQNKVKIKLGYFRRRQEANMALQKVHRAGFSDAFITFEQMNSGTMQLVAAAMEKDAFENHTFQYTSQSPYKVRLASYSDPLWFDTEKVQDLGRIEQWTKGSWTIFVLSGYPTADDASKARLAAVQRGFRDAELVMDNEGILTRLK